MPSPTLKVAGPKALTDEGTYPLLGEGGPGAARDGCGAGPLKFTLRVGGDAHIAPGPYGR